MRLLLVAPYWPGRPWFVDLVSLLEDSPWEIPIRRDLLSQAGGTICHPRPEMWQLWVWPLRGIASGLSTEVVETILQSRAHATRKSYAAKWQLFTSRCNSHQLNPVECSIGLVLEFLQDRFASGLSASTLNVYMAAIAAHHSPVGEQSLGKHPLAVRFIRGIRRLRPPVCPRMPTWDLAVVLEVLSKAPFELLEAVSPRFLTVKTVFLLTISSLKRVGDLQALSVAPSCLEFVPGMPRVFLYPRPGYFSVPQGALGSSTASYSTGILSTSL